MSARTRYARRNTGTASVRGSSASGRRDGTGIRSTKFLSLPARSNGCKSSTTASKASRPTEVGKRRRGTAVGRNPVTFDTSNASGVGKSCIVGRIIQYLFVYQKSSFNCYSLSCRHRHQLTKNAVPTIWRNIYAPAQLTIPSLPVFSAVAELGLLGGRTCVCLIGRGVCRHRCYSSR